MLPQAKNKDPDNDFFVELGIKRDSHAEEMSCQKLVAIVVLRSFVFTPGSPDRDPNGALDIRRQGVLE